MTCAEGVASGRMRRPRRPQQQPQLASHPLLDLADELGWSEDDESDVPRQQQQQQQQRRHRKCGSDDDDVVVITSADQRRQQNHQKQKQAPAAPVAGTAPSACGPVIAEQRITARLADRSTAEATLSARVLLPATVVFDVLSDPTAHARVFDDILAAEAELLEESADGARRTWRLDYRARWSFYRVRGAAAIALLMTTDRDLGTVAFSLRAPGFLAAYEGVYTIAGADGRPLSECRRLAAEAAAAAGAAGASEEEEDEEEGGVLGGFGRSVIAGSLGSLVASSLGSLLLPGSSSSSSGGSTDSNDGSGGGSTPSSPRLRVRHLSIDDGDGAGSTTTSSSISSSTSERHHAAAWCAPPRVLLPPPPPVACLPMAASLAPPLLANLQGLLASGAAVAAACVQTAWRDGLGAGVARAVGEASAALGGLLRAAPAPLPPLPPLPWAAGAAAAAAAGRSDDAPTSTNGGSGGGRRSSSLSSSSGGTAAAGQQHQRRRRELLPMQPPPPAVALISATTRTRPRVAPPVPINQCLKSQSKGQLEMMLRGLVEAAAAAAAAASEGGAA